MRNKNNHRSRWPLSGHKRERHFRLKTLLQCNHADRKEAMWEKLHEIQEPWSALLHYSRGFSGRMLGGDRTDRNLTKRR